MQQHASSFVTAGVSLLPEFKVGEVCFEVEVAEACGELALLLLGAGGGSGGKGEVLARLKTGGAEEPQLRLGRDFALDGELAEKVAAIAGVRNVSLSAKRGAPA